MKCTNPSVGRLITRYELGALEESEREVFVAHLIECAYCHNEVYSMAPFMSVLRDHRQAVQHGEIASDLAPVRAAIEGMALSPPFWLRRPVLVAASLLAALGAGLLALYLTQQPLAPNVAERPGPAAPTPEVAGGIPPAWPDLQIPKAVYTPSGEQPVLRGGEPTTAFERAMEAYQQNNFTAAAEQLEVVTRLEPEHAEAYFYRGVSLLLAGQSRDAMAPLKQAVQLSAGAQRERSHYYLALTYLKTNQPRKALAELEAVIQMNGPHRAGAEKLKQSLVASNRRSATHDQ